MALLFQHKYANGIFATFIKELQRNQILRSALALLLPGEAEHQLLGHDDLAIRATHPVLDAGRLNDAGAIRATDTKIYLA